MLAWLEKQGEQKPTEQEWSEEDEKMIKHIIFALPKMANGCIEMLPSVAEEYAERLKSLRPQKLWKPTEEQLKALDWVVVMIHSYIQSTE